MNKLKNRTTIIIFAVSLLAVIAVCFAMALCAKGYKLSITNIETKEQVALGDAREQIEEKFGEPCECSDFMGSVKCSYDDDNFYVVYGSDDCAALIVCSGEQYTTLKDISVGDDIEEVKKALGKNAEKMLHKTLYFAGSIDNSKPVSNSEVEDLSASSGYENLYLVDFGASKSTMVDQIMLGEYETKFGIIK